MTVGVVIPDLTNPIFPPIVRGIEHVVQPRDYTVLVVNTDSDDDVEMSAFESLLQRRVDDSSPLRAASTSSRSSRLLV